MKFNNYKNEYENKCKNKFKDIKMIALMFMMTLMFAFGNISVSYAANDLIVTHSVSSEAKVSKNGTVTVTMTIKTTSTDTVEITKLDVQDNSDFYISKGNSLTYSGKQLIVGSADASISETITYKGTGNRFRYTLTYEIDGVTSTQDFSLVVNTNPEKEVEYVYDDDDDEVENPSLQTIADASQDLNATPGKDFTLKLTVKNTSSVRARDIIMTAEIDNDIFSWREYKGSVDLGAISAHKTKSAELKLTINENAKRGVYPIVIKHKFNNSDGNGYTSEDTIYVNITKDLLEPVLEVKSASSNTGISLEVPFNLNIYLENIGGITAKNVKVTLKDLSNDTFLPEETTNVKYQSYILPSGIGIFTFPLITGSNATNGTSVVTAQVDYIDDNGKAYSDDKLIYLKIADGDGSGGAESERAKPKIVISNYQTSQTPVRAGGKFKLNFSFTNTSSSKRIRNLKVTLESQDGTFNITRGSNSFWISELAPKEISSKVMELRAKNDATSNSYPISVTFEYENVSGDEFSSTEQIYVQVVEDLNFVIGQVELPYEAFVDTPTNISFECFNMGKARISNLNVYASGDFKTESEMNYLGNIEAGKDDYFDVSIVPLKTGVVSGELIFVFEDTNGDTTEVVKPIKFEVMDGSMPSFDDDFTMPEIVEEEKGLSRWILILLFPALIVVFAPITRFVLVKRYKKKLEEDI